MYLDFLKNRRDRLKKVQNKIDLDYYQMMSSEKEPRVIHHIDELIGEWEEVDYREQNVIVLFLLKMREKLEKKLKKKGLGN